ncbi:MAG: aldo/keto reductase [Thermoplasmatales archaeon]
MNSLFSEKISNTGLGTWQLGMKGWGQGYDEPELLEALLTGLKNGINFVDTAEIYGNGKSESLIGKALEEVRREDVRIATKVAGFNATSRRVSRSLFDSLKRLKADYIDLYQVHWEPSAYTNLRELFRSLENLAKEGYVRHIGVSNFSEKGIEIANESMKDFIIESNQIKFNIVERPRQAFLDFMKSRNIKIIAWSPLAQGFLSGRYSRNKRPSGYVRRVNKLFSPQYFGKYGPLLSKIKEIASGRKISMSQLVLAYEITLGVLPIPGFRNIEQVMEIVGAANLTLTAEEKASIDKVAAECGFLSYSGSFYPRFLPNFIARIGRLFT